MKAKQKRKNVEIVVSNDKPDDADLEDHPRGEPPDNFETVLELLRTYLHLLSSLDRDQLRELIDQGKI